MSRSIGVPHEHISNAVNLTSYRFSQNTAGDHTVHSTTTGLLFVVYWWGMDSVAVTSHTIIFKSGSNEIGKCFLNAFNSTAVAQSNRWTNAYGMPYFIGAAAGEDFKVNLGSNLLTYGSFLVGEVPPRGVA